MPFCTTICPYCTFYKTLHNTEQVTLYMAAIQKEIREFETLSTIPKLKTIFLGGGTPSLLSKAHLQTLFTTLNEVFGLTKDCEITLEVNPETVTPTALNEWREIGINRLSIGIQSFDNTDLHYLGREHEANTIETALKHLQNSGNWNFNLDLMFSLKTLTEDKLKANINKALSYAPNHLSTYALSIEPKTRFAQQKQTPRPADEELQHYQLIEQILTEAGYRHYEVSAFAKPGKECQHNLQYWHYNPYIGFGPSAHSYFHEKRFENKSSLKAYLTNPSSAYFTTPTALTQDEQRLEYIISTLRLDNGFSKKAYQKRFRTNIQTEHGSTIEKLKSLQLLSEKNDTIKATQKGRYLLNEVLMEFMT